MCAMKTYIYKKNERKTTNCVEGFSQIAGIVNFGESMRDISFVTFDSMGMG